MVSTGILLYLVIASRAKREYIQRFTQGWGWWHHRLYCASAPGDSGAGRGSGFSGFRGKKDIEKGFFALVHSVYLKSVFSGT